MRIVARVASNALCDPLLHIIAIAAMLSRIIPLIP